MHWFLSILPCEMSFCLQRSFYVAVSHHTMTVTLIFPLISICWKHCASCHLQWQISICPCLFQMANWLICALVRWSLSLSHMLWLPALSQRSYSKLGMWFNMELYELSVFNMPALNNCLRQDHMCHGVIRVCHITLTYMSQWSDTQKR